MRAASRLFAAVKGARYLEPNTPTGLTGLLTHPAPRSALIYLYSTTLHKLDALPDDSVYRKSTEALTRHRLNIVESIKPAGYDEWVTRAGQQVNDNPNAFAAPGTGALNGQKYEIEIRDGRAFVSEKVDQEVDERSRKAEFDGGTLQDMVTQTFKKSLFQEEETFELDKEPALTADQVSDLEHQIGAGLIEEVIQVAEGELKLVDVMTKAKAWEDLEEYPVEGQWTYFARATHQPASAKPPQD